MKSWHEYVLGYDSQVDPQLQQGVERIDARLKSRHGLSTGQSAVGVLDLLGVRLALVEPDRLEYAASLGKVAILLAYFHDHHTHRTPGCATTPECARPRAQQRGIANRLKRFPHLAAPPLGSQPGYPLPSEIRHELGLMIKSSSNELATKFSRQLGLARIQEVLETYGFYDRERGGIWMGKHYGESSERIGDPIGDHSHAVTVRQLLRFYLLLEQGTLVGPEACQVMREIFASPEIPHDHIKFARGLESRPVEIRRKWGSWEDWLHDSAVITGPGRHYILVGLTRHPNGDAYLENLAAEVDDLVRGNISAARGRRTQAKPHQS